MTSSVDEIVTQIRGGKINAFAEIVAMFQKSVWQVTAYALDGRTVREDLVQQTFVDAFRHLDRFELGRDMGAWLHAIARNLVRQHLRKRFRADRRFTPYVEFVQTMSSSSGRAAEEETDDALRHCREQLAVEFRTALDLRYEQNRSFEQMAEMLNRTVPAVRQLLQRIRETLRVCMEKKLGRP